MGRESKRKMGIWIPRLRLWMCLEGERERERERVSEDSKKIIRKLLNYEKCF